MVVENRSVEVSFEEAEGAAGLRKAAAREGTLRIVSIHDLDRSACGGTHVRATGEIGPVLIGRTERIKQNVRVEFLCGARAVLRARADRDLLTGLAAPLSAAVEDLPALLEAQRAELKESTAARRELEETVDRYRARELYDGAAPGASGLRQVVRHGEAGIERLRGVARAVASLPRVVFVGTVADPPAVLLAASEDSGVDAGRVHKEALGRAGGRGGGNARLAQGSAPGDALDAIVEGLLGTTGT